jgi:hypothetical protein
LKKYARIENDTIMEIIDFDPKGKFHKDIEKQFVEVDETVKVTYKLKDNKFVEPEPEPEPEPVEPVYPEYITDIILRLEALEDIIKNKPKTT